VSFLYPRTVRITRSDTPITKGVSDYQGELAANERSIAKDVPASIQMKSAGGKPDANLPADARKTFWKIFIPLGALAEGVIAVRDIITDDLNVRYQVTSPYWNSLGYALTVERLET
jgi:hypothetical protein